MNGMIFSAPPGIRGLDSNSPLNAAAAAAYHRLGFRFAVRYVRRAQAHSYDLSLGEALAILDAGLGLMVVQHVESADNWVPTGAKGTHNGATCASELMRLGMPAGMSVWCDLEGVTLGVPAQDVIDYCNNWYRAVAAAGFKKIGLYVGWHSGLTGEQLYWKLLFKSYWSAYNLNADQMPAVRGVQMKQGVARYKDKPPAHAVPIDTNVTRTDALGGQVSVFALEGWPER